MQGQDEYGLSFTDLKHEYFECQCSDFNHVFRFVVDENSGEAWLEVQLSTWLPWYKRAWLALRYLFGKTPGYHGHYDVTLLREEDFARLCTLLDRSANAKRRVALGCPQEKPLLKG